MKIPIIIKTLAILTLLSMTLSAYENFDNRWKHLKSKFYINSKDDIGFKIDIFDGSIKKKIITKIAVDPKKLKTKEVEITCDGALCKLRDIVDINSLESVKESWSSYYKDKNHVYKYYDMSGGGWLSILDGADPATFAYIQGIFYKDKKHIYIERNGMIDVDYDSFTMFDTNHTVGIYYAKDKNGYMYRGDRVIDTNDSIFIEAKKILDGATAYQPSLFDSAGDFLISITGSGVEYPTKGDEHVSMTYGAYKYYVDIFHPQLTDDIDLLHFSTPFFRVYETNNTSQPPMYLTESLQILPTDASALSWHSASYCYFFAQRGSKLRGFMLEDSMDNQDGYANGIIFTFDGNKSKSYYWRYISDFKGEYFVIGDTNGKETPNMIKLLKPLLEYAKKQADGWPGHDLI